MPKLIEFDINENGCHICTSHSRNVKGYPHIYRNGKFFNISRYLWEQKFGAIQEEMCVCHKCDTPACINVEHFFLGTKINNNQDMKEKNRQAKGEKHGRCKLTEKQVLQIRQEVGSQKSIAKKYGVSRREIGFIKSGKKWGWLHE